MRSVGGDQLMSTGITRDEIRAAIKPLSIAVLRTALELAAIVLIYCYLPISGSRSDLAWLGAGMIALLLVVAIFVRQLIHITRAEYPIVRAVESLLVVTTLLICASGLVAYSIDLESAGAFNEQLTRIDAAYYSVTTFSTVGFGDIHPASEGARLSAIGQMLVNLAFLGAAIGLLIRVAAQARESRQRA